MAKSTDKARNVKQQHEKEWLSVEGVTAVGIGMTEGGDIGIIISVRNDAKIYKDQFPSELDGIPIEIQETGKLRAQ